MQVTFRMVKLSTDPSMHRKTGRGSELTWKGRIDSSLKGLKIQIFHIELTVSTTMCHSNSPYSDIPIIHALLQGMHTMWVDIIVDVIKHKALTSSSSNILIQQLCQEGLKIAGSTVMS